MALHEDHGDVVEGEAEGGREADYAAAYDKDWGGFGMLWCHGLSERVLYIYRNYSDDFINDCR